MFYSYKNLPVKINDKQFVCSEISFGVTNDIQPVYREGDRSTNDYYPGNSVVGSCEFSYYLTGADHLKAYISNDTVFLSGNVGGLYFNSGKLQSYSVDCSPNQPVIAKASIAFFDPLKGTILNTAPVTETYPSLNFSDVTIDSLSTYTVDPITNIIGLNFNYSAQIQPFYEIDEALNQTSVLPARVIVNEKTISTEITCDNIDPQLSLQGTRAGVKINLAHPSLPALTENFLCSGMINQKTFRSQVDESLITQISVIQHHTSTPPFITSFSPSSANIGDVITVNGRNFSDVVDAFIFSQDNYYGVAGLNVIDDQTLTFTVGAEARTGPIILRSLWGSTQTSSSLTVNYTALNVRSTNVSASQLGETIYIYGDNIRNVTSVTFGGTIAQYYSHLGSTGLLVQVPPNAVSGPIVVGSRFSLQTGTVDQHFFVPPIITGFTPTSGVSGDYITISGKNFTGITHVIMNSVPINFSLLNNTTITGTIPSGWTKGPITISGVSNFTTISSGEFEPILQITGVSPASGLPFATTRISGRNFDTGIMYPFPSGGWQVSFNGLITGFQRVNNTLLTGTTPSGDVTGPIIIYRLDGAQFPSNFIWQGFNHPTPFYTSTTGIFSGQTLGTFITGKHLVSLTGIKYSGISPNNIGTIINIPPFYIGSDRVGDLATITGFSLTGQPTGVYNLIALNTISSGIIPSGLTIFSQVNRAREYYVRTYSSSTGTTGTPNFFSFNPAYAIDGVRTNSGAIALTNYDSGAFWEIKLLKPYVLTSIVIYPWATGAVPLLTNFSGIVYNNARTPIWSGFVGTPDLPFHTLNLPAAITGKYFRIAKFPSGTIGVGEVEIY